MVGDGRRNSADSGEPFRVGIGSRKPSADKSLLREKEVRKEEEKDVLIARIGMFLGIGICT